MFRATAAVLLVSMATFSQVTAQERQTVAVPLSLLEDVLPIERSEDQRGRNEIAVLLARVKVNLSVLGMEPKELCRHLSTLAGNKVTFLFLDRGATTKVEPIELELKSVNLLSVMSAVQMRTGLRFVYRSGIVFLTPKEQVTPLLTMRVYDLRGAVTPLKSFPGPRLGLGLEGEVRFPPEEDSGTTVCGFTAEQIEALIKQHVTPELWGDKVTLSNQNGVFVVRTTLAGHRAVAVLLDELGVLELPRVIRSPALRR